MFKVVPEVPKPLLIFFFFLNSCFFTVLVECLFLPSVPNHWFEPQFPSCHLVLCTFLFISLCIAFPFPPILQPYSTISVSILITSVLNSASDRWSVSLSSSFFWSFDIYFFHLACISLPWLTSCVIRGWSLRYLLGQGNPLGSVVVLPVGEGSEREQCR